METLLEAACRRSLKVVARHSPSPIPTEIIALPPLLASKRTPPRTPLGKCKARSVTSPDQAEAGIPTQQVVPRPAWISVHRSLPTVASAVPVMAVTRVARMSRIGPVPVRVPWESLGRLRNSSSLHAQLLIHLFSMNLICIDRPGATLLPSVYLFLHHSSFLFHLGARLAFFCFSLIATGRLS